MVVAEIRAEMARQRITGTELNERLGWLRERLRRRLAGEVSLRIDELDAIARALNVPVSKFLPADPVRAA